MKKLSVLLALVCAGFTIAQTPVNDLCQGSVLLPAPGVYAGTNVNSTSSLFGTGTCGATGYDVWYRYTAVGTGNKLIASTCFPGSSTFNSGVDIFTGVCLGPPVTAGCSVTYCDQGSPNPTGGRAQVTTAAGVSYLIRVKGIGNGVTGTFNLYVDELPTTPQPNGTCASAATISNGINAGFSNFGEPAALAPGFSPCTSAGKDVFFSYTATHTGNTTARTCFQTISAVPALNIRDTVVSVYANCTGGTPIACNDDGCSGTPGSGSKLSTVQFASTQGATYIIQVAGAGTGTSAAEGNFDLEIVPPLVNDECTGAVAVFAGTNGPFSNQLATNSAGYSASCSPTSNDLFYAFTPTCGAPTTISTGCSGFDSVLQVYSACGGTELACNDNDPSGTCFLNSVVTVNLSAGTPYLIRVSSWGSGGQTGSYSVDITPGFGLNWSSPLGSGTVRFSLCNGPPNGHYYLFASLAAGAFPSGWFYGIDITLGDIASQIAFGFPFNAPLDGAGSFTSPVFGNVPPGLPIYSVAFALPPGSTAPSANSGAKLYVTQ